MSEFMGLGNAKQGVIVVSIDENGNLVTTAAGAPAGALTLPDGLGADLAYEDHDRKVARVEDQGVYTQVNFTAAATITSEPGKRIKGLICLAANTGGIVIYDNTAASGTQIYSTAGLLRGEIVKFPIAVPCSVGIHVVMATDGVMNVLWE